MSVPSLSKTWQMVAKDPELWKKWLIATVVSLVPILNFAVYGYINEMMQRHVRGLPNRLPDWSGLGRLWTKGIVILFIYLVYGLMALLVIALDMVLAFTLGDRDNLFSIFLIAVPLGAVALLALFSILPVALSRYAETGRFGSAFNLSFLFRHLFSRLGQWVIAHLIVFGIQVVLWVIQAIPSSMIQETLLKAIAAGGVPDIGTVLSGVSLLLLIAVPPSILAMLLAFHLFIQVYTGRSGPPEPTPTAPYSGYIPPHTAS